MSHVSRVGKCAKATSPVQRSLMAHMFDTDVNQSATERTTIQTTKQREKKKRTIITLCCLDVRKRAESRKKISISNLFRLDAKF